MSVKTICSFVGNVLDVYEKTDLLDVRNDLRDKIIVPLLDLASYHASHWVVDGEEADLILDHLEEPSDDFIEKLSPDMALEYIKAQRTYGKMAVRFEYAMTHPVKPKEIEYPDSLSSFKQLFEDIEFAKKRLDVASALLDVSTATSHDDEINPYLEKLSEIIRKIYADTTAKFAAQPEEMTEVTVSDEAVEETPVEESTFDEGAMSVEEASSEEEVAPDEAPAEEAVPEDISTEEASSNEVSTEESEDDGFEMIDEEKTEEEAPSILEAIEPLSGEVPSDGSSIVIM